MEKNLHEEGMEEFLRRSFDQYSENPPDDLWDRIDADLAATPEPALGLKRFWRLGLSAAAALLLGVIAFQHIYYNRELDRLKQGIEENTALLEALEQQMTLRPDQPAKGMQARTEAPPAAGDNTPQTLEPENGLAGHDRASPGMEKNKRITPNPSDKKKSENSTLDRNRESFNPDSRLSQTANENKTPLMIAETEIKPVVPRTGQTQEIRDLLTEQIPGITPGVRYHTPAFMPDIPAITPVSRSRWSAGLNFMAGQSVLDVRNDLPFPTHGGHGKGFEDAPTLKGVSYSAGAGVEYAFHKNWSLVSGLGYRKSEYASTHKPFLEFKDREPHSGQGPDQEYDFSYYLKTAGGIAGIELKTSQSNPNELIDEDELVDIEVTTETGLEYLSLPLSVKYRTGSKRLNFAVSGGLAVNYLTGKSFKISGLNFLNNKFKEPRRDPKVFDAPKDCKPLSADYVFSAGVEYRANEKLSLSLAPTFTGALIKKQLAPFSKAAEYTAGINMGLSYQF